MTTITNKRHVAKSNRRRRRKKKKGYMERI